MYYYHSISAIQEHYNFNILVAESVFFAEGSHTHTHTHTQNNDAQVTCFAKRQTYQDYFVLAAFSSFLLWLSNVHV